MNKLKKKKKTKPTTTKHQSQSLDQEGVTLKDQLSESVFAQLQAKKSELKEQEKQLQEEEDARRLFEKKQREKNMSFEELLNQYGDKGGKF